MTEANPTAIAGTRLWTPSQAHIDAAEVTNFAATVQTKHGFDWAQEFQNLWQWSVDHPTKFWDILWDWHGVIGHKGERILIDADSMPGATFFPDANLCYAENLLRDADDSIAISAHGEDGRHTTLTRRELKAKVMAMAGWLRDQGVTSGDRVAAYIPNIPEAIITLLASSTIGAVFSSCSPDFGIGGAQDRFDTGLRGWCNASFSVLTFTQIFVKRNAYCFSFRS